jgi:hypothetical protein
VNWGEAEGDRIEVELHDSVVVAMHPEGRTLIIRLSPAWVHRSVGEPGRDEGTVWNQDAIVRLEEAVDVGEPADFPSWLVGGNAPSIGLSFNNWIYDGSVTVGDHSPLYLIPAPIDLTGDVLFSLHFGSSSLRISAKRFCLDLVGEPEFIDLWPPA